MKSWMIGFIGGIVFISQLPALPTLPVFCLLACSALFAGCWRSQMARCLCGLLCGCGWASAYGHLQLQQRLDETCVKAPLMVSGVVSSLPVTSTIFEGVVRQRFEFAVSDLVPERCRGPSLLMLSYYGEQTILPGERWQFAVRLKQPWGLSNPRSYNIQAWFAQKGIDAVGSVRSGGTSQRLAGGGLPRAPQHSLRLQIAQRIGDLALDAPVKGILRAITVGDKSGLDNTLWNLLQRYGINHLLVISGLHIGLAAAVGYAVGGVLQRLWPLAGAAVSWPPLVLGLLMAAFYSALAGFTLPTQRALCMLGAFVCASLAGRSSQATNNVALAAALVLAMNPLGALGSGFWLSFGAVLALLWIANWQRGAGRLKTILATHGFMSLVMLPLGIAFFGGGSLVSMFANMLMIPLVGFVIVPLALFAAFSFLCGWPVESILWQFAAWPLEQLLPLAEDGARRGQDWLYHSVFARMDEVLLALLAVAIMIVPARPVLRLLAVLLALPLLLPALATANAAFGYTRLTVLDVGQGTAVVVAAGDRTLLYDTGGGDPDGANLAQTVVLPYLQASGVKSLDTLVISHPDLDHSAGAAAILHVLPVGRLRYGGEGPEGIAGRACEAGEAWRWPGGQTFQFLSPAREHNLSSNNGSCVLQVDAGGYRFLLPGDIESRRERVIAQYWREALDSDWLLAAHHGSKTSSSTTLLKYITPATAVISSGYASRFGHPHPVVLQQLKSIGAKVLVTASSGAITFEVVSGEVTAERHHRRAVRRYWM